jgi:flagellar motor switch protein FliN/FliY
MAVRVNPPESITARSSAPSSMGLYMSSNIAGVKVEISVVLGSSTIPMHQLLRMGRGAVIELDSKQDDPVLILANDKPVAKGEIIIHGDKIGVSITDILKGYT